MRCPHAHLHTCLLQCTASPRKLLLVALQAVYDLYDIVAGPAWPSAASATPSAGSGGGGEATQDAGSAEATAPASRIVVIGRYLDRQALQSGLDACAVGGSGEASGVGGGGAPQ